LAQSRPTITKRLREKAKQEKRMRKAERKAQREAEREAEAIEREEVEDQGADADPDIADIVPGPQKPVWWDGSC